MSTETAENATPTNQSLSIEEKLGFIANQAKTHNLSPEFVFEVMKNHACAEQQAMKKEIFFEILGMAADNFPAIGKILQAIFGEDKVKVFKRISIENEDKSIFTPETINLKKGDFAKVKLPGDSIWSEIVEYNPLLGEAFAVVTEDLINSKEHGVELGDTICFNHSHIFDYKALSPEEAARATATAAPEENLTDLKDASYDILKHNAPTKDEPLDCTAQG